jgi:hypothetical protein
MQIMQITWHAAANEDVGVYRMTVNDVATIRGHLEIEENENEKRLHLIGKPKPCTRRVLRCLVLFPLLEGKSRCTFAEGPSSVPWGGGHGRQGGSRIPEALRASQSKETILSNIYVNRWRRFRKLNCTASFMSKIWREPSPRNFSQCWRIPQCVTAEQSLFGRFLNPIANI